MEVEMGEEIAVLIGKAGSATTSISPAEAEMRPIGFLMAAHAEGAISCESGGAA